MMCIRIITSDTLYSEPGRTERGVIIEQLVSSTILLSSSSVFIFCHHPLSSSSVFIFRLHRLSSSSAFIFRLHLLSSSSVFIVCLHCLSSSSIFIFCLPSSVFIFCLRLLSSSSVFISVFIVCLHRLSSSSVFILCLHLPSSSSVFIFYLLSSVLRRLSPVGSLTIGSSRRCLMKINPIFFKKPCALPNSAIARPYQVQSSHKQQALVSFDDPLNQDKNAA